MPVQIQDVEVVAQPPSQAGPGTAQPQQQQPASAPHPELQLEVERAARMRRSRDLDCSRLMPDDGALQSSRPTIVVDGQQSATLTGGQLRARVREDVHGLYDCELEIGNWGPDGGEEPTFLYFNRQLLDFGKQLTVTVSDQPIFSGRITGIEARFPEGGAPSIDRARRGSLPGPADDAPHADVHKRLRR